jgi:hypothetical protein
MAVDTVLSALNDILPDYALIRDCVAGQRQIKKKRTTYLPYPDEGEPDASLRELRYTSYLARAVFYGVTGRTLRGLVGLVFDTDPAVEVPELLKPVLADATGSGTTLDQQAQATLGDVVGLGRAGILTDYPKTNGQVTRQQQLAGNIKPTIIRYEPEQIINWRTKAIGAKLYKTLIVLKETFIVEDDGFAETTGTQHRVLKLVNGQYVVEIHRDTDTVAHPKFETYVPTDGKGKPFPEIPFEFVGAEDNDATVDRPPLLDIAELNVAHYRNSADYEESAFLVGQPTPVFSGLTKQWVDEVFTHDYDDGHGTVTKRTAVRLGSRAAVPLPAGGKAELLQADPNTIAFEAMEHKEKQMIALGAKLIENTGTQQTATEATIDSVMDNSVLGTCARNTSMAYRKALNWAWLFMTGEMVDDPEVIDYELSTDFDARGLTSEDRAEIIRAWQAKAITFEEMRWNMKRAGVAYLDDEEAKEQLEAEAEASIEMEAAAANALGQATGQVDEDGQPIPKPPANAE